jgi:hypothetical protein
MVFGDKLNAARQTARRGGAKEYFWRGMSAGRKTAMGLVRGSPVRRFSEFASSVWSVTNFGYDIDATAPEEKARNASESLGHQHRVAHRGFPPPRCVSV